MGPILYSLLCGFIARIFDEAKIAFILQPVGKKSRHLRAHYPHAIQFIFPDNLTHRLTRSLSLSALSQNRTEKNEAILLVQQFSSVGGFTVVNMREKNKGGRHIRVNVSASLQHVLSR